MCLTEVNTDFSETLTGKHISFASSLVFSLLKISDLAWIITEWTNTSCVVIFILKIHCIYIQSHLEHHPRHLAASRVILSIDRHPRHPRNPAVSRVIGGINRYPRHLRQQAALRVILSISIYPESSWTFSDMQDIQLRQGSSEASIDIQDVQLYQGLTWAFVDIQDIKLHQGSSWVLLDIQDIQLHQGLSWASILILLCIKTQLVQQ